LKIRKSLSNLIPRLIIATKRKKVLHDFGSELESG